MWKNGYFTNMVDKFLHKIDLDALKEETGLTIDDIGELVGIKNHKGVYNWAKNQSEHGTRPSYNALIKLLVAGATVKTLFGVNYSEGKKSYPNIPPEFLESSEFKEGLYYQLMEGIKKNGLVKEEQVKYMVRQELEKLLPELKNADKI